MATNQRKIVEVGGVRVTIEQLHVAIDALAARPASWSSSRSPCDYHAGAEVELSASLDATAKTPGCVRCRAPARAHLRVGRLAGVRTSTSTSSGYVWRTSWGLQAPSCPAT